MLLLLLLAGLSRKHRAPETASGNQHWEAQSPLCHHPLRTQEVRGGQAELAVTAGLHAARHGQGPVLSGFVPLC